MVDTRNARRQDAPANGEDNVNAPVASQATGTAGQDPNLANQIDELRDVVRQQAEVIQQLQACVAASSAPRVTSSPRIKAPPVTCYSGKPSERNSEKFRSFFYSVCKFGALNHYSDEQMLAFAECYLQDRAAFWIMRLEREGNKPTSLDALKKAMIEEFVPANEKAKARVRLMDIKVSQSDDLEDHIAKFEDLITLCDTPVNEAYVYFFNSLPSTYKAKFAEKFPTSQPISSIGEPSIHVAYEYARTLDLSYKLSTAKNEDSGRKQDTSGYRDKRQEREKDSQRSKGKRNEKYKKEWKDDSTVCWGPAQQGEGGIYRKYDRCCVCGLKGWSEPSHPCRKDNKRSKGKKDSDSKKE